MHMAKPKLARGGSSEAVAQQREFSIDIGCTAKGQGEETCSKGTGSRKAEQGRPAGGKGRNAGAAGGNRGGPRRPRSLTKVAASALQRPPSSRARTTSLHRADFRSSGYVPSLALRAGASAAPADLLGTEIDLCSRRTCRAMRSVELMQVVARQISAIRSAFKQCDAFLKASNVRK